MAAAWWSIVPHFYYFISYSFMCDSNIYLYFKSFGICLICLIWTILVNYIIVVWCNIWTINYWFIFLLFFINVSSFWCIDIYQSCGCVLLFAGWKCAAWNRPRISVIWCFAGRGCGVCFTSHIFNPQTINTDQHSYLRIYEYIYNQAISVPYDRNC
jgi:hypothetical protein